MKFNHQFNLIKNKLVFTLLDNKLLFFAFIFHIIFMWFRYEFFLDESDILVYWNLVPGALTWLDWQPYPISNSLMIYLNYPFFKFLGLPVIYGFLMYSVISFVGYYVLYKWWDGLYKGRGKIILLFPLFFSPSLHFWNNSVGKEALLFSAFVFLFYNLHKKSRLIATSFMIPLLMIMLIRPHFGVILLVSAFVYYLIYDFRFKAKSFVFIGIVLLLFFLSLYLFKFAFLIPISFENFRLILKASHEFFKESSSYVPLETYYYPYKIFTFFFRPFIGEQSTWLGIVSGLENTIFFTVISLATFLKVSNYKEIKFPKVFYFILIFSLIYSSVFVLAYSNFGLLSRTKALVTPFIWMISLYTIGVYLSNKLGQKKNKKATM